MSLNYVGDMFFGGGDMMNLEDVPDMNVGDMVNEYTSGVNVSYMIHSIILLSFIRHVIII